MRPIRQDTIFLCTFCILLAIVAIQSGDILTLIFGIILASLTWYLRRKRIGKRSNNEGEATTVVVQNVTNVFNDSAISGDINIVGVNQNNDRPDE